MAEPFVFYFKPGEGGHPEVMYIADVLGVCALCRHEEIQRFYHSTPLHGLTFEVLELLADRTHLKTDFECNNCGEPVAADETREAAITFGFPDDAGLVRIWVHHGADDSDPGREYQVVPDRRLDPQELPGWEPDDEQGPVLDALDEWTVEELVGRAFNPKIAWRDIIEDWLEDPAGGAWTKAGPGYYLFVEETTEAVRALADDIDEEEFVEGHADGDLEVISLADAVPVDLVTHEAPETMPGHPGTWLRPQQLEIIEARGMAAEAHISVREARRVLERAFALGQLSYDVEETERDVIFRNLCTPRDVSYPGDVSLLSVLRRAVYTGLTPGDAARLTAEEIIGVLLRVWA